MPLLFFAGLRRSHAAVPTVQSGGRRYVQLSFVARMYTMTTSLAGDRIRLKNKYNTLEVEVNGRRCWINGTMVWLHEPCRKVSRQWSVVEVDFTKLIDPIMRPYAYVPSKKPRVVVLDPGHGAHDKGAVGARNVQEKLVVKDVMQRVTAHLKGKGVTVKTTRSTDIFLELQQRCDLAAKWGADVFVSIHADGAASKDAHGVETFILTAAGYDSSNHYGLKAGSKSAGKGNLYDSANAVLGYYLQRNMVKNTKRSDRGLRRARFLVIKNAPCPAALVECGFVTNPTEEALMLDSKYREAAARGISDGILNYLSQVNRARSGKY
ncbi:MAG: N-acetylmuramoyl-L-alanine amidase [Kiritimatiellales bacterium]|nr:N-acetylmuramoyl-L-alanine amidase [Kiritimatiellales bacterium]